MLPTICEAAGAKVPSKLTIDGQSFLPQLRDESGTPRDSIYMWYSRNGNAKAARAFARNQRYKLYESGEFFDIAKDRMEKNALNADSLSDEQRSIKALLQIRIDRFEGITPPGAKK